MLSSYPIAFVLLLVFTAGNVKARPFADNKPIDFSSLMSNRNMMSNDLDSDFHDSDSLASMYTTTKMNRMRQKPLDVSSMTNNVLANLQQIKANQQELSGMNLFGTSGLSNNKNGMNGGMRNSMFNDDTSDDDWRGGSFGSRLGRTGNSWNDNGNYFDLNGGSNNMWDDNSNVMNDPMNNNQNSDFKSPVFSVEGLNGSVYFDMNNVNSPAKNMPGNDFNSMSSNSLFDSNGFNSDRNFARSGGGSSFDNFNSDRDFARSGGGSSFDNFSSNIGSVRRNRNRMF
jgi:hypothetical protein